MMELTGHPAVLEATNSAVGHVMGRNPIIIFDLTTHKLTVPGGKYNVGTVPATAKKALGRQPSR